MARYNACLRYLHQPSLLSVDKALAIAAIQRPPYPTDQPGWSPTHTSAEPTPGETNLVQQAAGGIDVLRAMLMSPPECRNLAGF
jgi:hypothetical protein